MKLDQWLAVTLEEYKALRTESLTAMKNQHSILSLGATFAGIAFSFSVGADPQAQYLLFAVLIPLFTLMFFTMYAQEFSRMVRVGRYIEDIETKMRTMFNDFPAPLKWETWLSTGGFKVSKEKRKRGLNAQPLKLLKVPTEKGALPPPRLPYYPAVPVMFGAINLFSFIMSWKQLTAGPMPSKWWNLGLSFVIFVVVIGMMIDLSIKLKTLRDRYDIYFVLRSNQS